MTEALTIVEKTELQQCEILIEHGFKTFIEVGAALMKIRDSRLYRQEFGTFEEYCNTRWGLEQRRAYLFMDAAKIADNLKSSLDHKNDELNDISFSLPTTERQFRALSSLDPTDQPIVWQRAVETSPTGIASSAHVAETVKAYKAEQQERITPPLLHAPQVEPAPTLAATLDSNEWYTPVEFIEAARRVMGSIDLDPASNDEAQAFIKAGNYYTKETNGLSQTWKGNVWLNPPYADPLPWVAKLTSSFEEGTVTSGILLVNTANSPQWSRLLWHGPYTVCLLNRRVSFWRPDRMDTRGTAQDQMIWYVGNNAEQFNAVFSQYGAIR